MPQAPAPLRAERDRFLAFAFAAADALVELDAEHRIGFAAGATRALLGAAASDLVGRPVLDLVPLPERARLRRSLETIEQHGRFAPLRLHLGQARRAVMVSGSILPDQERSVFLALRTAEPEEQGLKSRPKGRRDQQSGLHDAKSFEAMAREALAESVTAAAAYQVSLIETEGLQRLSQRLDAPLAAELMGEVGNLLREHSAGGDAAAKLEGDRYGIVHAPGLDIEALNRSVESLALARDPDRIGLAVKTVTMDLAPAAAGDAAAGNNASAQAASYQADSAQALVYAISSFAAGRGAMTLKDLSEGSRPLLRDTVARITEFRQVIAGSRFEIAYQPVVSLKDRAVHHYEALVRFPGGGSPFEQIVFAENVGLIADFDLAVAHKVLDAVAKARVSGRRISAAINLSGRSLETPAFLPALHKQLQSFSIPREQILFEITESAQIRDLNLASQAISSLRVAGCPVCLDDFGAGASAFQYLRSLAVDFVKIDGAYVKNAVREARDRPFLKAIAGLCRDLGIATIAEMIEDEETVKLLVALGVDCGQGYLFGRPEIGLPRQKAQAAH